MKPVIERLFQKRDLLNMGDESHTEIRPMLIICGGSMRGVYGAATACVMHELDLGNAFDVVVGLSTGAGIAAYGLSEQILLGTTVYYDDLTRGFITYNPLPKMNIDYLEQVFRTGKKLDTEAIKRHRSRFLVGVTNWKTGGHELIDAKSASPDLITAIKASLAAAPVYQKPVLVNGHQYTDGSLSRTLPIDALIKDYLPTDILIIANRSEKEWRRKKVPMYEQIIKRILCAGLPPQIRQATAKMHFQKMLDVDRLIKTGINYEVIFSPEENKVGQLTTDPATLREGALASVRETAKFFGCPDLEVNLM